MLLETLLPRGIRRVLTATEENALRFCVRLGIIHPMCVAVFTIAIIVRAARGRLDTVTIYIWCLTILVHLVLTCVWVRRLRRFVYRLKGEEKEEFLRLYWHLHDCSKVDDILEIAITIDHMATLIGDQYSVVRDFVLRRAGMFLIHATAVPLRLPESHLLTDVLYVLRANLEELPEYLSSETYWLKEAATQRLEELQSAAH